jgi:PKD repeat protein
MKKLRISHLLVVLAFVMGFSSCKKDKSVTQPTAKFTFTLDTLAKTVSFTNASLNATGYSWIFGDGLTSTTASPQHTYAQGGSYIVKLTAVGEAGSTPSVLTDTINVPSPKNFIKGGSFETTDAQYWTILHEGQKDSTGALTNVKYQFGYTTYKPTLGTGGSLFIFPNNTDAPKNHEEGTLFTQSLGNLAAGTYQISTLLKFGGEDSAKNATGYATNYWIQIYISPNVPTDGNDANVTGQITGWYFGAWTGWQYVVPAIDGFMPSTLLVSNLADADGKFTLAASGTYYLVFKVGKGGGSTFGSGIALDNLTLNKLDAQGHPIF